MTKEEFIQHLQEGYTGVTFEYEDGEKVQHNYIWAGDGEVYDVDCQVHILVEDLYADEYWPF